MTAPIANRFNFNDPVFNIINAKDKPLVPYEDTHSGVYLGLPDFDEAFHNAKNNPVVINDIVIAKTEDRQKLNDMIFTTYSDAENLELQASCSCGHCKGDHIIDTDFVCEHCNTKVMYLKDRKLESKLWIRAPDGVDALMSPAVFGMLSNGFVKRRIRIFEWAINPGYRSKESDAFDKIRAEFPDFKRGINWVYRNFDAFIAFLLKIRVPMQPHKANDLRLFVEHNRNRIWFKYIPIPSSQVFVKERSGDRVYSDITIVEAIEAIRTVSSITNSISAINNEEVQRKAITAIKQLHTYYYTWQGVPLTDKKGLARKHIFGSRLWFTARAVITSQHWQHKLDDLVMPWGLFISLMRLHIAGILMREKSMSAPDAARWINKAMTTYSDEAYAIIRRLIETSNNDRSGVRVHFQRNPTLRRLSIQAFYVCDVWLDPEIYTVAMSPMVLANPNSDFDGDQMNITLALDDYSWQHFNRHAPYTGMMDNNRPFTVSSVNNMPVPMIELASNWIEEERTLIKQQRL